MPSSNSNANKQINADTMANNSEILIFTCKYCPAKARQNVLVNGFS